MTSYCEPVFVCISLECFVGCIYCSVHAYETIHYVVLVCLRDVSIESHKIGVNNSSFRKEPPFPRSTIIVHLKENKKGKNAINARGRRKKNIKH